MPTTQAMSPQASGTSGANAAKAKEQHAEALVRRDNEAKAKRAQAGYEGLPEGLTLGVKMGDGAFSNVFAATLRPNKSQLAVDPTLGETVKVAVKCVRKFELNSSQVSNIPSFGYCSTIMITWLSDGPAWMGIGLCWDCVMGGGFGRTSLIPPCVIGSESPNINIPFNLQRPPFSPSSNSTINPVDFSLAVASTFMLHSTQPN